MFHLPLTLRLFTCVAVLGLSSPAQALIVDLGEANHFSALTFSSFTGLSGDTGSLLAVGGDANLSSWAVNANHMPAYNSWSMIVAGNFTGNDGAVLGQSFIGGSSTTTGFSLGAGASVGAGTAPLDFAALKTQLSSTSAAVATAITTGSVAYVGGTTQLSGSGQAVEVFAIDGNELSHDSFLQSLSGVRPDATLIFNVSGTHISMASFGFDLAGGNSNQLNLLFNFYEARTLSFSGLAIEGSVLAPLADVTGSNGHIGGTFVANSFSSIDTGHFEFHDLNFNPTTVTSVPEPDAWLLLVAGLSCLACNAKRRRHP